MAYTPSGLMWLQHFLQEDGFPTPIYSPIICDNQAILYNISNPVFYERSKYIEIGCHFIWDKILSENISTSFVKSEDQLANIFIKSLGRNQLKFICSKLGLYDMYTPAWGGAFKRGYPCNKSWKVFL